MKKSYIIVSLILLIGVFAIVMTLKEENIEVKKVNGDVFANPHQLGENLLYKNSENKFVYYKPVDNIKDIITLSKNLNKSINFNPINKKNVFDYKYKKIYIVENRVEVKNRRYQHAQIQYHGDDGEFIIFSAYEVENFADDFKKLRQQYEKEKEDLFGNEVRVFKLNEDVDCIYIKNTFNESLNFMYYDYNQYKERITLVNTVGNEILVFKNDILYHIVFTIKLSDKVIVDLLNNFIK